MNMFIPVYQTKNGRYLILNTHLISRIEPSTNSSSCDYNIYMNDGFQIRVYREYYQNRIAFEILDSIYFDSTRGEEY